jgi:signal transduction histidine kinase
MKEIVEEFDDYLSCNIKDEKKVEKIAISHLVDYLNNYYKEDLKEKNIDLKIRTNCPNLSISVDLSKFKRVFCNIITNSIRHYNKTKKVLIININEEKNGKIKFEIADNGCGCIEDLVKIFDPLYTTDKSRKISGLGLSICKEVIESHNGTIKAVNNKLGGFSIIFIIDSYKED